MSEGSIDMVFENISYPIKLNKSGGSPILKSVNGGFSSGQLSAILGRSGAGKTTLLNILAGQICTDFNGIIKINGNPVDSKKFRTISCYITQDALLQPRLTVKEYMMISADLMLSRDVTKGIKDEIILKILTSLSMEHLIDTRTECLSGGQKKRLSIAIELINDPHVILLDEPTSGLDNVAAKECLEVLKNLASKGKIIICSIHQPSDSIFRLFDRAYFINDGGCIYDAPIDDLVPFLEECGYPCPKTYNPADYVLELDNLAYEELKSKVSSVWNKRKYTLEKVRSKGIPKQGRVVGRDGSLRIFHETRVLLRKNFMQLRRKKTTVALDIFQSLFVSTVGGLVAMNNGNNAERALDNFKSTLVTLFYLHFTYLIIPILSVPSTTELVRKEIRNSWYSPLPYLIAEILISLPSLIILPTTFSTIAYVLVFAEVNFERILLLNIIFVLAAFILYTGGLCIGTLLNPKSGAILGPASAAASVMISVIGLGGGEVNPFLLQLRQLCFSRYILVGTFLALYEGRPNLECSQIFCLHGTVQRLFKDLGIEGSLYSGQVTILSFVAIVFLIAYYLVLRLKFASPAIRISKRFCSESK